MSNKKVLLWDIEMFPGTYYGWSQYDPPMMQIEPSTISCIAYKWEGEEEVHTISLTRMQHMRNPRNEKILVKKMLDVINEADVIIAHNGDRFDWKKFNARVLQYGFPPVKQPKMVDTLKMVKSQMRFDSHRLGCLAKFLKVPLKVETRKNIFTKALTDYDIYKEVQYYCAGDVITLEAIYHKLKPHCKPSYHAGRVEGKEFSCASCGSDKLIKFGTYISMANEVQRYRCKDCGSTKTADTLSKKAQTRAI